MQRSRARPAAACAASDLGDDRGGRAPASRGRDEDDVGRRGDELVRHRRVRQRGDERLALRRPRGDRRALDAEVAALEVDVVQLVAVDEPAGGGVADLGVVLPAVPEPADHLDVVGGLVEQRRPISCAHGRIVAVVAGRSAGSARRPKRAASCGLADTWTRTPGPAVADVVERGDRLGDVERLGVGDDHGRDQPDVPGQRRDPGGDQHRVEPAAHLVGAPSRRGLASDCRPNESSMVTKSSRPRSASATRSAQ